MTYDDLLLKVEEKAQLANFKLETNSPEKLSHYFRNNMLNPIKESVIKIDSRLYDESIRESANNFIFIDSEIIVKIKEDKVEFKYEKATKGDKKNLTVNFKDGKSTVGSRELEVRDLEQFLVNALR